MLLNVVAGTMTCPFVMLLSEPQSTAEGEREWSYCDHLEIPQTNVNKLGVEVSIVQSFFVVDIFWCLLQ